MVALVPSHMNILSGEQRGHFGEHLVHKFIHLFVCRVQGIFDQHFKLPVPVPFGKGGARVHEFRFLVHRELRVSRQCRHAVSRQVDFGDDGDVSLSRILYHIPDLFLGIESAVGGLFYRFRVGPAVAEPSVPFNTRRPHLCQSGKGLDLDPPSLVIGQVPVKHIEFVLPHPVNEGLDLFHGEKMAAHVQHQSTPFKTGIIHHPASRDGDRSPGFFRIAFKSGGQQLPQGLNTVMDTARFVGRQRDGILFDLKLVSFLPKGGIRLPVEGKGDHPVSLLAGLAFLDGDRFSRTGQHLAYKFSLPAQRGIHGHDIDDPLLIEHKCVTGLLDTYRCGNDLVLGCKLESHQGQ